MDRIKLVLVHLTLGLHFLPGQGLSGKCNTLQKLAFSSVRTINTSISGYTEARHLKF